MTSVERVLEYSNLKPEAPLSIPEKKPPAEWPQEGQIVYRNMELRYEESEPLVLKGLTCTIQPREKVKLESLVCSWSADDYWEWDMQLNLVVLQIGIVGRTGAGKSSIMAALFRLTEPKGTIEIDGVSIAEIGLHDLRQKISIIPQVRSILDL